MDTLFKGTFCLNIALILLSYKIILTVLSLRKSFDLRYKQNIYYLTNVYLSFYVTRVRA